MVLASLLARKQATAAISSGSAMRPSGILAVRSFICSSALCSGCSAAISSYRKRREGVSVIPGENAFTRIRSEEHTSELQSLMRISYAVFCLKKQRKQQQYNYK